MSVADQPLHVVDQSGQPFGSVRRCCSHCGRMCWAGVEGSERRWTNDWDEWRAAPDNCTNVPAVDAKFDDATLPLEGGGPIPPRPTRRDAVPAAARALARKVGKLEGLEGIADDVVACRPSGYEDGLQLAKLLESWRGYDADMEMVDALEGWGYLAHDEEERLVREWAAKWRPPAPFENVARVRVTLSRGREVQGYAYTTGESILKASCYVVEDDTPLDDQKAWVVKWEAVDEVFPLSDRDRERDARRRATENRWAYDTRAGAARREKQKEADAAIAAAKQGFGETSDAEVADVLAEAAGKVRAAASVGLDPDLDDFAMASAALSALWQRAAGRAVVGAIGGPPA